MAKGDSKMANKTYLITRLRILIFLVVLGFCSSAGAKIIYVDDDGPADLNNIQAAIDDANDGDTIIVADGTYTGLGNRDIDFKGKAIIVLSTAGAESTFIDCQGSALEPHRGFKFHSGEGLTSQVRGFSIINGYAPSDLVGHNRRSAGGAIYCYGSSPTISDCIITHNSAVLFGGGIACAQNSNPIIANCIIRDNTSNNRGGGLYCFFDCDPYVTNCLVVGNSASIKGGGMYFESYCDPVVVNCTMTDNLAGDIAGLYCQLGSTVLKDSILWGNVLTSGGMDESAQIGGWSSTWSVNFNCIQGFTGTYGGIGNILSDPLFTGVDDFTLSTYSPCIDAGDPNYVPGPNETDLDGNPRVLDGNNDGIPVVDMGAYEYRRSILAEVDIDPDTLNLASKGKWISCYIWLGEDYDVADIDPRSLLLENEIEPQWVWLDEEEQIAMARFSREELQAILNAGDIELTITGCLTDWTLFKATDTIKVIDNSEKKKDHSLVAHWKFDHGSGSIAIDSAGRNDGILFGDPSWTTGIFDGALSFDGDGDYVAVDSIDALAGDCFTVHSWICLSEFAGVWNPVMMQHDLSNDGCYFYIASSRPSFYIFEGSNSVQAVSPETMNADQWYPVAVTNDGSTLNLYVDGLLKATASSVGLTGADYNAYIGCEISNPLYYNGLIDDVRIYNRALTADEIALLAE
jgi:hypothetical protein